MKIYIVSVMLVSSLDLCVLKEEAFKKVKM